MSGAAELLARERAKFYELTAAGRRRLRQETESWNRIVSTMAGILDIRPGEV